MSKTPTITNDYGDLGDGDGGPNEDLDAIGRKIGVGNYERPWRKYMKKEKPPEELPIVKEIIPDVKSERSKTKSVSAYNVDVASRKPGSQSS